MVYKTDSYDIVIGKKLEYVEKTNMPAIITTWLSHMLILEI